METKANTALVGAFALVVLGLAFVFIYWLARGSEQGDTRPLTVIFNDPVTGLAVGSQVVFNGIKIGDVQTLTLDDDRPQVVIAGLAVQPLSAIKKDTQVTLGFQGLTGVGYVEMAGGTPGAPPIWQDDTTPTLVAARSSMQDLLAGARGILGRADQTLKGLETMVNANIDNVNRAVANVEAFTNALSQNSDNVATFIEDASAAAKGIAEVTQSLQGVIGRAEALSTAVDPDELRAAIEDIRLVARNLAAGSEQIDDIAARIDTISQNAEAFSTRLPALTDRADALIAAIDPDAINRTVTRIGDIASSVSPEEVRKAVDGMGALGETLSANRENIDTLVTRLSAISGNVETFSVRLPALGERVDTLLMAIDGQKVGQAVDDIQAFASTLRANTDNVNTIIADAKGLSARFDALGARAESLLTKLDSMAGEGTGGLTQDARDTLASVRAAADAFTSQINSVGGGLNDFNDRGLREVRGVVSEGQRAIQRLDSVISDIEQNPSGFIFRGESVPEYDGRRR